MNSSSWALVLLVICFVFEHVAGTWSLEQATGRYLEGTGLSALLWGGCQSSYIKILNIACQLLFDGEDGLSMIRFNCIHLHIASCNMSPCCNMFLTGSQKKLWCRHLISNHQGVMHIYFIFTSSMNLFYILYTYSIIQPLAHRAAK